MHALLHCSRLKQSPWVRMSVLLFQILLCSAWNSLRLKRDGMWNLHHPWNVSISFFLHPFYLSLNQASHTVCPLCLHATTQTLSSDEQLCMSALCMSVSPLFSRLHFYGHAFRSAAALHEDCRLWEGIPGTALNTCASRRISSAMLVMCQPRRGYRLLPIFGKSLSIAPPQPDWQ